ncbi:MAG: Flp pilus assembly complex ATPase component TadA, partial [Planctomycetes bacterium]|nr:Flp pilus assembly complex ATPase component TadA [Planctomycetota bacterium]
GSTFPTNHGERVAIRLFDPEAKRMRLEELGFAADVLRDLQTSLAEPEGLIFLSGPSGSGKTTTLYACLEYISREFQGGRNIVSVEDPVEVDMPGVTQTAVKRAVGLDFAQSLRSLLRQDPEVIMVGEVRDPKTARIAVEAGLTGHLVLSTVHASRAALVPHRLLDMGVEPYALAGALELAISQRLLRRVCPRCGGGTAPRNDQGGEKVNLDNTEECSVCHGTGYSGRILLTEELKATETLHEAIMDSASRTRFQGLSQSGLEEDAKRLLAEGKTTKLEVRRVLGEVEL